MRLDVAWGFWHTPGRSSILPEPENEGLPDSPSEFHPFPVRVEFESVANPMMGDGDLRRRVSTKVDEGRRVRMTNPDGKPDGSSDGSSGWMMLDGSSCSMMVRAENILVCLSSSTVRRFAMRVGSMGDSGTAASTFSD
jgi:hypothetical protein